MLQLNTSNLVEVMENECMYDENEYILMQGRNFGSF